MALKIFRAIWFLSVLAVLARLLFSYAGWQEELVILEEGEEQLLINKEALFYIILIALALINVMVYAFAKLYRTNENLRSWIHGLITSINVFFIVGISLISLFNSAEKFRYDQIDFIIYGSVALVLVIALVWPVYALSQKIFVKQPV